MAQQRLFQPALSEVGAPTYVSPGVQDNSMAMLIGGLGGQAVEAYKGYQIAGLEQEQEKAMSAYLNRPSDEAMLGWGEEVQNQAIQIETQWASPSATWEGVNVAEKKLQEAQSKLIRAAEQGIFTPEQLNVRMTANLREAINRNPGLQQELVAQTAKLLEYSGMNALLKGQASLAEQQAAAAKRQADMDEYIYKQTGVNFFANPELKEFAYTTFAKQHEADRLSKEYALRKSKGELNKQELSDFVSDPIRFGNQVTGGLLNMENEYRLWRMENPTADASNTSIAFQNITNKYIAEFSTLLNLPDVRPQVQQAIDMFKDKQKLFEDIARGGVRAEQAENLLKAQRALLSLPNVPVDVATEHALKLAQLMSLSPNPDFDKLQPVFSKLVNNIATYNTTKSPSHNPIIGVDPKTEAGKTAAGFTSALVPDNKELNRKTIDTFLALEQQAMESGTPAAVHSQIVAQVASNWLKTAQQNKTTLGQMLDPTEVVKLQDWVASKMAGFNKMTIDYDPGNKRYVASLDGQINNQATNTLNDLINIAGSLAGYPPYSTETNAAAGQVMSQPQAGQSGSTNPGNLKDLQGNVRTFASQEEGIRANAEQLKLYFTRGSQIDKRPLTTVKAIINSWRLEKDIRKGDISQQGYIDFVAKSLGVAPDQQLQPTNHTLAKLIAAMSIREGNPVPYEVVIDALIGTSETAAAAERPAAVAPAAPKPAAKLPKVLGKYEKDIIIENERGNRETLSDTDFIKRYGVSPYSLIPEQKAKTETKPKASSQPKPTATVPQKETEAAKAVRDALGVSPPKGVETKSTVTRDVEAIKPGSGKWYYHSKNENGTYLYNPSKDTYVLVAPGKESEVAKKFGIDDITKIPKQGKK